MAVRGTMAKQSSAVGVTLPVITHFNATFKVSGFNFVSTSLLVQYLIGPHIGLLLLTLALSSVKGSFFCEVAVGQQLISWQITLTARWLPSSVLKVTGREVRGSFNT